MFNLENKLEVAHMQKLDELGAEYRKLDPRSTQERFKIDDAAFAYINNIDTKYYKQAYVAYYYKTRRGEECSGQVKVLKPSEFWTPRHPPLKF